jgi:hypothetical protein
MKSFARLSADLKHVRLIHFTLLVVCVLCIYSVFAAGRDAYDIWKSLQLLNDAVPQLKSIDDHPKYLATVRPDWAMQLATRLTDVLNRHATKTVAFESKGYGADSSHLAPEAAADSVVVSQLAPFPKLSADLKLHDLRERLKQLHWRVESIADLTDDKEWQKSAPSGSRGLGYSYVSGINLDPTRVNLSNKHTHAVIHVILDLPRLDPQMPDKSHGLPPITEPCETTIEFIDLGSEWFATMFPQLDKNWERLPADVTLREACDWGREQLAAKLEGRNPKILGVEVEGKDLGLFGPAVVIGLLGYILGYLLNLRHTVGLLQKRYSDTVLGKGGDNVPVSLLSEWFGCMQGWWPWSISALTLTFLPAVAVGLPLWRLAGWDPWICVPLALVTFALGIWIIRVAGALAKMEVSEPSGKSE